MLVRLALVALIALVACAPSQAADPPGVYVELSAPQLAVGDELLVTVRVVDPADGCQHPIMDVTLSQLGPEPAILRFDTPATLGPPGPNPAEYRLTAVAPGTVTLRAVAFGESNCSGWQWESRSGRSPAITITQQPAQLLDERLYLPLL